MTRANRLRYVFAAALCLAVTTPATAQTVQPPYEARLIRLSEIVGSVHYLRTLCLKTDEGWRTKMQALIDLEATDPERRARFVAAFNKGYRSFASVHRKCNTVAIEAEELYRKQGLELASEIIARYGN
ncbi:TIGR02301 family protein [Hoeflea prorocentri]|uniref:TIGR02301 family protein n=1 Tax=Hoeflea prorocentri TaxID=1922333 RepID=A0A9X3UIT3_9HYPH|nr:TIGR02301 family protein [Hoeflea prorocentri]MCY6381444.1 TIGR02301 family protein [Hoeflea prorocentri]MDA5399244.1 TIGR02301 family protein [Hoeflea prorocentri]